MNRMTLKSANDLFNQGKFENAREIYSRIRSQGTKNYEIVKQLGKIALFSNHFKEAENFLKEAIILEPKKEEPKILLTEVFYRQDKFQEVVSLLQQIGKEEEVKRFKSFKGILPNQIKGDVEFTKIDFIKTDPLPIIKLKVNEDKVVNFFIDTGAAETILDKKFAEDLGVEIFFSRKGTFAGAKKASVQFGKINSITLGEFTIKNLPVVILPVRHFSELVFGGTEVDGIIGTTLFYHFITTMDYVEGELILRRKNKTNLSKIDQEIKEKKMFEIPFWMAGDHYIVAWGRVNKSKPLLFFVDTGLAGGGFTCPESTIKEAGIDLLTDQASVGVGGGGKVQTIPFIVDKLSLGAVVEYNIRGVFTGGTSLNEVLGFQIGGIISHMFFRKYALTFDFIKMRLILQKKTSASNISIK